MKKLIIVILLFFTIINIAKSQTEETNAEIWVKNYTSGFLRVALYPVSVVFCNRGYLSPVNGWGCYLYENGTFVHNYINGCSKRKSDAWLMNSHLVGPYSNDDGPGFSYGWDVDNKDNNAISGGAVGVYGHGTYKLEIIFLNEEGNPRDSLLADFDYYSLELNNAEYGPPGDLEVCVYGVHNFTYQFVRSTGEQNNIVPVNYIHPILYTARAWHPNLPGCTTNMRPKRNGPNNWQFYGLSSFVHGNEESYSHCPPSLKPYNFNFPLDTRILCNTLILNDVNMQDQNHRFPINEYGNFEYTKEEIRQGKLKLNLLIENSGPYLNSPLHTMQNNASVCNYPSEPCQKNTIPLEIDSGAILRIRTSYLEEDRYTVYNLYMNSSTYYKDFYFYTRKYGKLNLDLRSQIIANNRTHIIFDNGCYILADARNYSTGRPHIIIKPGADYCNLGANISGPLWLMYSSKIHQFPNCATSPDLLRFSDSMRVQLSDSAEFEIPDNKTLLIDGAETNLILDSNSTIKFGNNAKLVVKNGANINAIKSKFTSLTAGAVWDGIYLEDVSNDVLKNCIIENAMSGINVKDKSNEMGGDTILASVEISDCQFINSTPTPLVTGIYLTNSNNALIRNNTFTSTSISNGFSSALSVEYCPSGNINIMDNTLNYSLIGISVIQSSPYIARNTITGQMNSYFGIFLDNSSGIIKNNSINNFVNSICTYYSSPYLLKNNFSNAIDNNLEFHSNSAPIMKPIVSGSSLYWYSGNNNITGTPNYAGIKMNDCSGPEIDAGYNIIAVNGSSYMTGTVPDYMDGTLYATYNNWQDQIPIIDYFDVDSGAVEYDPTFDGVSVPGYDTYDTNSIGFGLYDTVFISSGDSPNAGNIFSQAYKKEIQKQYNEAINLYKDVIRDNKKSPYALSSFFRILNCYEKKSSNNNHYTALQNYLSQIKNNNTYSLAIREIAEDLIIKTKIKLGLINNAIQNYTLMYQQNQNNPKGFHALINKEYLTSLLEGDNSNGTNNLITHKLNLISLLTGDKVKTYNNKSKVNIPDDFVLLNNYPNPFNPSTTIKFGLPKKSFVNIKIFDITGREIQTLVNEHKEEGYHTVLFNGYGYSSGIYFYKMEVAGKVLVGKMLLIK